MPYSDIGFSFKVGRARRTVTRRVTARDALWFIRAIVRFNDGFLSQAHTHTRSQITSVHVHAATEARKTSAQLRFRAMCVTRSGATRVITRCKSVTQCVHCALHIARMGFSVRCRWVMGRQSVSGSMSLLHSTLSHIYGLKLSNSRNFCQFFTRENGDRSYFAWARSARVKPWAKMKAASKLVLLAARTFYITDVRKLRAELRRNRFKLVFDYYTLKLLKITRAHYSLFVPQTSMKNAHVNINLLHSARWTNHQIILTEIVGRRWWRWNAAAANWVQNAVQAHGVGGNVQRWMDDGRTRSRLLKQVLQIINEPLDVLHWIERNSFMVIRYFAMNLIWNECCTPNIFKMGITEARRTVRQIHRNSIFQERAMVKASAS